MSEDGQVESPQEAGANAVAAQILRTLSDDMTAAAHATTGVHDAANARGGDTDGASAVDGRHGKRRRLREIMGGVDGRASVYELCGRQTASVLLRWSKVREPMTRTPRRREWHDHRMRWSTAWNFRTS